LEVENKYLFDHNGIKLEINKRNNFRKFTNLWKFEKLLLKNKWIKKEIKMYKTNKNGSNILKLIGCCKSNAKREVYNNNSLQFRGKM
jgi:hypothetical protein